MNAGEEDDFVRQLGPASTHWDRVDLTAVLTALHSGAQLSDMLHVAPGLDRARMAAAHNDIASRLTRILHAFQRLISPDSTQIDDDVLTVAEMYPQLALRLLHHQRIGRRSLQEELTELSRRVAALWRSADDLAQQIAATDNDEERQEIGQRLFKATGRCLYGEPLWVPRRVGELSATKTADLLGERRREATLVDSVETPWP